MRRYGERQHTTTNLTNFPSIYDFELDKVLENLDLSHFGDLICHPAGRRTLVVKTIHVDFI